MTNGVDLEMVQRQEGERPSGKGIANHPVSKLQSGSIAEEGGKVAR